MRYATTLAIITVFKAKTFRPTMRLPRAQPRIRGVPVSIETARSLSKAARDVVLRRRVPEMVQTQRLETCRACPSWDAVYSRCTECGCQMRVKTALSSSECPLKKWGPHISEIRE